MQQLLSFLVSLAVRSIALAAVALAAIWILRVKSAAARHAMWTSVVFGMLALMVLAPVLPPVAIPVLRVVPQAYVFPETAPTPGIDLAQPAVTPSVAAEPQRAALDWQDAAAAIYFLGVLFFLARLVFGYLFTVRLVRASEQVKHSGADWLYESTWISVPFTVGFLRPRILLPAGWRSWEASKYDAVLAHERTHIRRADWAISLFAGLNRCIFWCNPLSWWLERTLASLAEQACDDAALLLVKSEQYAQALLDMAAAVRSAQGRMVWEAMAMAKAGEVKQRIERILDDTRQIPPVFTRARWITLLACTIPLVYFAAVVRPVPALAQSQPKTPAEIGEFLKGKRQLSPSDVSAMEQYLATNPHDLDVRSQLVLYYFANGAHTERNNHIFWLIANHPESTAAVIGSLGISPRPNGVNDATEYERVSGLWRQQAAAHPNDTQVLANAAQFLSQPGGDLEEAERLLLAAAKMQPSNQNWSDKLGKVYAKAILGATGDPVFPNSAPELAARVRLQLETSNDRWLLLYTGGALQSVAQRPAPGKPLPVGVLNLDDHARLLPAIDLGERLIARSRELGVPIGIAGNMAPNTNPVTGAIISQATAAANSLPPAPPPVYQVEPVYPPLARQARIQGVVRLAITIDASGSVQQMSVISGHPLMAPASLEAVRRWTFPSGSAGKYLLAVNFTLPPGDMVPATANTNTLPSAPVPTYKVEPVYPPLAQQAHIQGVVKLQVTLDGAGAVQDITVISGHPLLAPAALEAMRHWTFPAGSAGKYMMDVNFTQTGNVTVSTPDGASVASGVAGPAGAANIPARIRVGGNVQASQLTHKVDAIYPPLARTGGIEGIVTLRVTINEDGTVQKVEPLDGHPLLLAAAAEAVRQWTYRATLFNGKPVQVETTVAIPFELNQ